MLYKLNVKFSGLMFIYNIYMSGVFNKSLGCLFNILILYLQYIYMFIDEF